MQHSPMKRLQICLTLCVMVGAPIYTFKKHFGKYEFDKYGVDGDEYCKLGTDAACLELMIQGPEFHLERILNQPFLE